MSIHETMKQITEIAETFVVSGKVQGFTLSEGQLEKDERCIIFHNDAPDKTELVLGDDFEVKVENGKTFVVRKTPQYPKTFDECLKILGYNIAHTIPMNHGHNGLLMMKFQRLIICRDAYWKIAGEQMGLGKPWKPDWLNAEQDKYVLFTHNNAICSNRYVLGHNILAFHTEEMRDTFYENFKELIEECKELL